MPCHTDLSVHQGNLCPLHSCRHPVHKREKTPNTSLLKTNSHLKHRQQSSNMPLTFRGVCQAAQVPCLLTLLSLAQTRRATSARQCLPISTSQVALTSLASASACANVLVFRPDGEGQVTLSSADHQ